jgi:benzoylformate decarboxylase
VTGARALLDLLARAGVRHLFGNPGTTELPLMDELVEPPGGVEFVLALQESVAVGMADGYAQAAGGLGALLLHCTGGVANGLGLLYNARRAGTPLLVLSGQQDTRLILQDPFLHSDMVRWVSPFCKWAHEVRHAGDLPRALRRAVQTALAPPTGPVFLSLPLDVLQGEVDAPPASPARIGTRLSPDPDAVAAAAEALAACRSPAVVAGDRVAHAGAETQLLEFAEALNWPVYLEPYPGRFIFPTDHPLYRGPLPRFPGAVRKVLAEHDGILAVGLPVFEHFLYDGEDAVPDGIALVHVDSDPSAIGRNHPTAVGLLGDIGMTLAASRACLPARPGEAGPRPRAASIQAPGSPGGSARSRCGRALRSLPAGPSQPPPDGEFTSAHVAHVLSGALDPDCILVEEAISARGELLARVPRTRPGTVFGEKGGTIGWGFPAALGVALARPGRRVVAVTGDGSFAMAAQGLWTMARLQRPLCLVVLDNGGYGILRQGLASLGGRAARAGAYPGTDAAFHPAAVAAAFGVAAETAEAPGDFEAAVRRALAAKGPAVVVAKLRESVRPLE